MPKISLTDEKSARQSTYSIPHDGIAIVTEKIVNNQIIKFGLTSINENNTQIISIQPHFVLCNFSKYQLKVHAFCIHRNEKLSFKDVTRLVKEKSTPISILNNQPNGDNNT